jgi:hypothetical protein
MVVSNEYRAMIVAVPAEIPVTTPPDVTAATVGVSDRHCTLDSSPNGASVASWKVVPMAS